MAPRLSDPAFQSSTTDEVIFDAIKHGHPATPMIGWSDVLSDEQIQQLVAYIRELGQAATRSTDQTSRTTDQTRRAADRTRRAADRTTSLHGCSTYLRG